MSSIHILCATDNIYIPYCGVMVTSVFENNVLDNVCIHVLGTNLNENSKTAIMRIAEKYGQQMCIYDIQDEMLNFIPPTNAIDTNTHITLATYNRIFVAEILPQEIEKVLYLDCDLIVRKSLKTCWEENIDNYALGAVLDSGAMGIYSRLKLDSTKYLCFNGGVLLINLKYWRANNIQQKCISYIIKNQGGYGLLLHDQDTLNVVAKDCCLPLHPKYNVQPRFFFPNDVKKKFIPEKYLETTLDACMDPVIIHYSVGVKPWYRECSHPLRNEWLNYLALTEWKDMPIRNKYILYKQIIKKMREAIKKILNRIVCHYTNTENS